MQHIGVAVDSRNDCLTIDDDLNSWFLFGIKSKLKSINSTTSNFEALFF